MDLIIAMLGGGLGLVEAGQAAIVAFVQLPGFFHRHPGAAHFSQRHPQRADRTGLVAGESGAEVGVDSLQKLAGLVGFSFALLRQVCVPPSGEAVFEVPGGLSVTDERELWHRIQKSFCVSGGLFGGKRPGIKRP